MVNVTRVLLVEADPSVAQSIQDWLTRDGFAVTIVTAPGEVASVAADQREVVLIGLPDGDRLELCRALRRSGSGSRILMLVPDASRASAIIALEAGADDVIGRHGLSMRELSARLRALARRRSAPRPVAAHPVRTVGPLRVHETERRVDVFESAVDLTPTEFAVLITLISRPGEVVRRREVVREVWGERPVESRTVDTVVKRLRARLGRASRMVTTVRGVGYRFDAGAVTSEEGA